MGVTMQAACRVRTRICNSGITIRAVPDLYRKLFWARMPFSVLEASVDAHIILQVEIKLMSSSFLTPLPLSYVHRFHVPN